MPTIEESGRRSVFDAQLPVIDYLSVEDPEHAHAIIREAREQAPIAIGPHGPELLSYELVHAALRDPRFCVPPGLFLEGQGITSGPLYNLAITFIISLDGKQHQRLRRLVAKAFTPRATARLRGNVVEVITRLVDRSVVAGRCDVVTDIAREYPIPIICALLGAPAEDWKLFSRWAEEFFKLFNWNVAAHESTILAAWEELSAYVDDMVVRRRHTLTDDLVSGLICAEDDGDHLSQDELSKLVATLLMAGTDTTRNQLAASVQVLCDHPEQWALLAEHPELAPNAVEETMRHSSVSFNTVRITTEDVDVAGVVIPSGTMVIANTGAANRDPAVYDDPDRLDITREGGSGIQTFGGGMHYCLGAHLARLELAEGLKLMTQRMPNAHRTGPAPWKSLAALSGPTTVPIEFDTCRR